MSSYHYKWIFLVSVVLLVSARDDVNESHSEEQQCYERFCDALDNNDTQAAEGYLKSQLCEPACEEELETALRVAHLNYDHVRTAFGACILIIVVIFAKLCECCYLLKPTIT